MPGKVFIGIEVGWGEGKLLQPLKKSLMALHIVLPRLVLGRKWNFSNNLVHTLCRELLFLDPLQNLSLIVYSLAMSLSYSPLC